MVIILVFLPPTPMMMWAGVDVMVPRRWNVKYPWWGSHVIDGRWWHIDHARGRLHVNHLRWRAVVDWTPAVNMDGTPCKGENQSDRSC